MNIVKTIIAIIFGIFSVIIFDVFFFKVMINSFMVVQIIIGTCMASIVGRKHPIIQGMSIAIIINCLSYMGNDEFYSGNYSQTKIITDTSLNILAGVVTGFIAALAIKYEVFSKKIEYPIIVRVIASVAIVMIVQFFLALFFLAQSELYIRISAWLFAAGLILVLTNIAIIIVYSIANRRKEHKE